jgi:taurine dioxygenase
MSIAARKANSSGQGLTVVPQQPRIGAEIYGIDLRNPLTPELRGQLRELLLRYKVLFFRDQDINREQHIAFGRQFGDLTVHPLNQADQQQEVQPISAERFRRYSGVRKEPGRYNTGWHSDETFRANPPYRSILRALVVPDIGGDTVFADAVAAYESLPGAVRERIGDLKAVHSAAYGFGWYADGEKRAEIDRDFPPVEHPVVRIHPETGARVLFVNSVFTSHIAGLSKEESDSLLSQLTFQFTRPELQTRFKWHPGSIAFWDNRAAQHYGVYDYGDNARELERVTIKGGPV